MKIPSNDKSETLHALFPTLVYQARLEEYPRYQSAFADARADFGFARSDGEQARYNAGEYHGKILLHHVPSLRPFFDELAARVGSYLKVIGVRAELFEVQCLKSWLVFCDHDPEADQSMVAHNHSCSDISWVYYPDVPEPCAPITFHAGRRPPTSLFESTFHYDWHDDTKSAVSTFNWWNSETWSIHPQSGDLLLFPGHQLHAIDANVSGETRISVAGDLALTLRPEHRNLEFGRTSPKHWLTLPVSTDAPGLPDDSAKG